MIFSYQISKLRKEANLSQEDLAEKCDVSRQAVAKWENGESVPDIYRLSHIARLFEVSLDELVWGEQREKTQKEIAKNIYYLLVENMESLRSVLMTGAGFSSNQTLATELRIEIKKSRLVFSEEVVEELLALTNDFGKYYGDVIGSEEYANLYNVDIRAMNRSKQYLNIVIPQKYNKFEMILKKYLELP